MRVARATVVLALAVLLLVACGRSQAPSEARITLKEWAIEPTEVTVRAGRVTFEVQNAGALEHDFVIEGVEGKVDLLLPGDTQTLVLTLSPGSYTVICSVPGHKEAGMIGTLVVR